MSVAFSSEEPATLDNDQCDSVVPPSSGVQRRPTPVPRLQLFVIILIQIAEPITATVIYPFVNQFVRDTGVTQGDERKTGYYAGLIESVFFLAEALTVFQWGWLSDQLGRKPVLLLGPLGLTISMLGFGLSKTFVPLVLFRCMQGVFNGNIGVSKSVLAEISDETNIGDLFSMLPLMWSMGITVGPIIGGVFANPADRWPAVFGHIELLKEHPYLIPCAMAGCLAMTSFMVGLVALRETLPSAPIRQRCATCVKRNLRRLSVKLEVGLPFLESSTTIPDYGSIESYGKDDPASKKTLSDNHQKSSYRNLLVRPLLMTYLNYFFIAFTEMAHNALLPLMYSSSISLGGLGLDAYSIGMLMGTFGLVNATLQLKYLGRLTRRYGPRLIYICSYMSFLICIGLFPLASHFCKRAGRVDWIVGSLVFVQLAAQIPILACYASMHILVVSHAPKGHLGASNGIAQMIASIMRSIAPTVATSLFSVSLERSLAGGYMVYYILLVVVVVGIRISFLLPQSWVQT
ncbi:MFS general substrate transporter [Coprinopsis marcescibilis]|uniref:MFS general substrate transporter n=1 Tax=Coprinopsis marcescibilis TaxID=230819 RepID=A0A5C3L4Z2_COPMA|nr:MFS general substrate transporter [Coprinopsis marcescibilis]